MGTHSFAPVIEEAYQQTLGLLVEARDFAACRMVLGDGQLSAKDSMVITAEQYRLTSRLASILAWLMSRRAVNSGQVQETDEIVELARLDCKVPGQGDWRSPPVELPGELDNLIQRCRLLHDRMMRLYLLLHRPAVATSKLAAWGAEADGSCRREADRRNRQLDRAFALERRASGRDRRHH